VGILINLLEIVAGLLKVKTVTLIPVYEYSEGVGFVSILFYDRTVVFDE
jgi:hypothetical protein